MEIKRSDNNPSVVSYLGNIPYIIGDYQYWEHEETGDLRRRKFYLLGKHGDWERVAEIQ